MARAEPENTCGDNVIQVNATVCVDVEEQIIRLENTLMAMRHFSLSELFSQQDTASMIIMTDLIDTEVCALKRLLKGKGVSRLD